MTVGTLNTCMRVLQEEPGPHPWFGQRAAARPHTMHAHLDRSAPNQETHVLRLHVCIKQHRIHQQRLSRHHTISACTQTTAATEFTALAHKHLNTAPLLLLSSAAQPAPPPWPPWALESPGALNRQYLPSFQKHRGRGRHQPSTPCAQVGALLDNSWNLVCSRRKYKPCRPHSP